MTTILFWDIDGTLLTTARAGIHAWEEALQERVGKPVDLASFQTAGLTDVEIARRLAAKHEIDPTHAEALLRAYERRLPDCLSRRTGAVFPNVRAILERLRSRSDVYLALLTGNTRAGAGAKLRHYALAEFFDGHGGAFADGTEDRAAIAREAIAQARSILGVVSPDRVYVIGDTPHDVACGKVIGARVVAVATGGYTVEQLRACNPWLVWTSLPEPDLFLTRLGLSPSLESV